jgi:ATP-dependent 26S proteasome regulatory subunit
MADQLGGLGRRRGVFVVATAGNPSALEPTLGFRSGRFDRRIELGAAPLDLRRSLLEHMVERHQPDATDLLERLVGRTTDWTVSELVDLEQRAVLDSVRTGEPVDLLHALDPSSQRRGPGGGRDDGTGNYL